jgi:hypothetical protein
MLLPIPGTTRLQEPCGHNLPPPKTLGEPNLLCLQSGVPRGGNNDELVAVPLSGLAEFDVERLFCWGDRFAARQDHLPGEGPAGAGDHGNPIAASELDWVRVAVDVHVWEYPEHLLYRCGVRYPAVDWVCAPRDVRDHVWMVDRFHPSLLPVTSSTRTCGRLA